MHRKIYYFYYLLLKKKENKCRKALKFYRKNVLSPNKVIQKELTSRSEKSMSNIKIYLLYTVVHILVKVY
jgi:hypothetical protein